MVRNTFPEDPDIAQRIVTGETAGTWDPEICGPMNRNGTIDCGLWQINDIHLPTLEKMGLDRLDPEDATKFARHLYDRNGGWGDWMYYLNHIAIR